MQKIQIPLEFGMSLEQIFAACHTSITLWKTATPEGSSQHSDAEIGRGQNIEPMYHWEI